MTQQLDKVSSRAMFRSRRAQNAYPEIETRVAAPYDLSPREMTVLYEVTQGLSDMEIAMKLGVTKFTVNKHVGAILSKMNVASRTGAAVRAIREHLVP